jgi:hypothetical protein
VLIQLAILGVQDAIEGGGGATDEGAQIRLHGAIIGFVMRPLHHEATTLRIGMNTDRVAGQQADDEVGARYDGRSRRRDARILQLHFELINVDVVG